MSSKTLTMEIENLNNIENPSLLPKNLKAIFEPQSIAIIGATNNPDKIGHQLLKNICESGYPGKVFPVNPSSDKILNLNTFPNIQSISESIDLAIIVIPAHHVAECLEHCGQKGVKAVVVISSGFAEVGKVAEERKLKQIADQYQMALLGPNVFGLAYSPTPLNASFGPRSILPGKIAFITQSGALGIALMGWTVMEKIGLASLVNLGNKADIEEKELIEYFNNDNNVQVVLIYMEGIKNGRKFMTTKIKKPIVVLKVGTSQKGSKAAASHTGSLAGADAIYEAAFKQLGILRASSFNQAFAWGRSLSSLPAPTKDDTIILTNGGGIGVRTTDECEVAGVSLLDDTEWLESQFRSCMPSFGSTKNPVDLTGQANSQQYQKAAAIAFQSEKIGAIIVLYCETIITNPLDIARALNEEYINANKNKPIVVYMVGGDRSRQAINYLNENGIPAFDSVNLTVSSVRVLNRWEEIKNQPPDTPVSLTIPTSATNLINQIKNDGRHILMEHEARQLLEGCGVPVPPSGFAQSKEQALHLAQNIYPLAMKVASPDIVHKTEVGGVIVNIQNAEQLSIKYDEMMTRIKQLKPQANIWGVNLVRMVQGIECIVGLSHDVQFGPVVMFGLGGVLVEALKDVSFRIVPFGKIQAGSLLNEIKAKKILDGFRGMQAHKISIIETLCAVQKLSAYVKEVDINPLITNAEGSFAADARIIL